MHIPLSPRGPLSNGRNLLEELGRAVETQLLAGETPIRFAVTASSETEYRCEAGLLTGLERKWPTPLFQFVRRPVINSQSFNAVLLVPTGIGAEIGGHAGDASPVAGLLSAVCDTLITHPNVVNASDIIELPGNALYVEGSVISRLLMGSLGLQRTRNNRLLVVLGHHQDELFINAAINSVNAARATYGLTVPRIVQLGDGFEDGIAVHRVGAGRRSGAGTK